MTLKKSRSYLLIGSEPPHSNLGYMLEVDFYANSCNIRMGHEMPWESAHIKGHILANVESLPYYGSCEVLIP